MCMQYVQKTGGRLYNMCVVPSEDTYVPGTCKYLQRLNELMGDRVCWFVFFLVEMPSAFIHS